MQSEKRAEFTAEEWSRHGDSLCRTGQFYDSLLAHRKALELAPSDPYLWSNFGVAFHHAGLSKEALHCFDTALSIDANHHAARLNKGMSLRLLGEWAEGWKLYESRSIQCGEALKAAAIPDFNGMEDIAGKRVLAFMEQGLGDFIQFMRFVPRLVHRGARVSLACDPKLRALVRPFCQKYKIDLLDGVVSLDFEFKVSVMSLPHCLSINSESDFASSAYLEPLYNKSPGALDERKKIGLAWQGSRSYSNDLLRSIPLKEFLPLFDLRNTDFVSLQKGFGSEDIQTLGLSDKLKDLGNQLDRGADAFVETAQAIQNLDLVITSDSAIAHLAGALGAPTWLILSKVPDWRWGLQGTTSPWYQSLRLYRQTEFCDWAGPISNIVADLKGKGF